MSRRSRLSTSQHIDLAQRRRTTSPGAYSEQPVQFDTRGLPGAGEGGSRDPAWPLDYSWLSPDLSWMDPESSWLGGL